MIANKVSWDVESGILNEVLEGLNRPQKFLPSKLFYDERGSRLFDRICDLDEYYPTRTEMKIMEDNIGEICSLLWKETLVIELGSGNSRKIRLMLDNITGLAGYVPIDISSVYLHNSARILKQDYPGLDIYPVDLDFTQSFELPEIGKSYNHILVYYPGSSIGNFTPREVRTFLKKIALVCGRDAGMLVGVDLKKDKCILERAYNDKCGITAKFNLNILDRINCELGSNFKLNKFKHYAFYNEEEGRIEMRLVSLEKQKVCIGNSPVYFEEGENIVTEYSYKYSLPGFEELVSESFTIKNVWKDSDELFSIQYMTAK
jgi:dimethylhistidine N-methyltransferase